MRLLTLNHRHQILKSIERQLIVDSVWTAGDHHTERATLIVVLAELYLLRGEQRLLTSLRHLWLVDTVHVELLRVHEALSDDDLAFEQSHIGELSQVKA